MPGGRRRTFGRASACAGRGLQRIHPRWGAGGGTRGRRGGFRARLRTACVCGGGGRGRGVAAAVGGGHRACGTWLGAGGFPGQRRGRGHCRCCMRCGGRGGRAGGRRSCTWRGAAGTWRMERCSLESPRLIYYVGASTSHDVTSAPTVARLLIIAPDLFVSLHTPRCQIHPHTNTTTPPSAPSYTARAPTTPPNTTPSRHAQAAIAAAHAAATAGPIRPERQTGTKAACRHGNSCASPCPWAGARSRGQCMYLMPPPAAAC